MTDVETFVRNWRGILSVLGLVISGAMWAFTLRTEVIALRTDVERLDSAGSQPVRQMQRRVERIEESVARTDTAVREIRAFLCGTKPLCGAKR